MKKLIYFLELLFTRKINSNKMKNFTFFISILTLFVSCNSGNGNSSDSPQENGLTAGEIERPQPMSVLEAGEICMSGFDGDSINMHGVIKNTSPADSYKDVVVKVTYYSDAKKKLGNKEYTIPEVFPPHSDVRVELKVENCKDVNTIGWEVIYARVEKQIK
ncbi:MAG: hypothetical protein Q7W13_07270 [Bacteroidia bacterium]|nr:hypothetical protein [Bacteroidia bacterium]